MIKSQQSQMLFTDVLEEMLETKKGGVAEATYDNYLYISSHIKKGFHDILIDEIKPKDLEVFYQSLKRADTGGLFSDYTVRGIRKIVNLTLRYAYVNQYIKEPIYTRGIKLKPGYRKTKDSRFLSLDDVASLLEVLQDHPKYYTLVRLLVSTGLRIGEALALEYADFDRGNGVLHVTKSLKKGAVKENCNYARETIISDPKTVSGARDIPIPEEVFNLIENWRCHSRLGRRGSCKRRESKTLVFQTKKGAVHSYHTFMYNFTQYLKRHGYQKHVTFHMLRHTYGSLQLEKGVSLAVVSRLLGHKNIDITANVYITITKPLLTEASDSCIAILKDIDASIKL